MTYKIKVKTIDDNYLTFTNVKDYTVFNDMVLFTDSKTGLSKQFHVSRADIEEEKNV
jgi:hypothetical protein